MELLDKAIAFAAKAHKGVNRKMSDVPYISHPYSVGMILTKAGCSDEMVAAGILHDVVEDTEYSLEDLTNEFGKNVADIVAGCSEPDKSLPWKERKEHTVEYLKTAPIEIQIVTAADKLHNVRSIQEDYKKLGEDIWTRFNKGKSEQAWYYTEIVKSLREGVQSKNEKGLEIITELEKRVNELF